MGRLALGVLELGLAHLQPQVVALAGALADPGEDRDAAELDCNVPNQLLDRDRLADPRAAEQADLAAFRVGAEQVNNLDAGFQNLNVRRLVFQRRRGPVDRVALVCLDRPALVNWAAQEIKHAAQRRVADGNRDGRAGILDIHAAHQAVGGRHGDAADDVVAEVLGNFDRQIGLMRRIGDSQRIEDFGQLAGRKLRVYDGSLDLDDFTDSHI